MGMDIYGLSPQITGTKPVFPDNWHDLSDKAQSFYWEIEKDWEKANPGHYFRANVWSWRPIHMACLAAIDSFDLEFDEDAHKWAYNSGDGLKTSEDCNLLADALDNLVEGMKDKDVKMFGYNMTECWTTKSKDNNGYTLDVDDQTNKILNMLYLPDLLIVEMPIHEGITYYPSHVTEVEHLEEFINFLRHCNGFKVL
jgi:hypothetical protein